MCWGEIIEESEGRDEGIIIFIYLFINLSLFLFTY